ncbi:hypothetical protein GCM10025734_22090 [Kitasatospora paranensis]
MHLLGHPDEVADRALRVEQRPGVGQCGDRGRFEPGYLGHHPDDLDLFVGAERFEERPLHADDASGGLPDGLSAVLREGQQFAPAVGRIAPAQYEAAADEPRDHFGHRRLVQRRPFAHRALVGAGFEGERQEDCELRSRKIGSDVLGPQAGVHLLGHADEVAGRLLQSTGHAGCRDLPQHHEIRPGVTLGVCGTPERGSNGE